MQQDTYSTASTITLGAPSYPNPPQNQPGTPGSNVGTPVDIANRGLPVITKEPPPGTPPTCATPTNRRQKSWDMLDQNALPQVCSYLLIWLYYKLLMRSIFDKSCLIAIWNYAFV